MKTTAEQRAMLVSFGHGCSIADVLIDLNAAEQRCRELEDGLRSLMQSVTAYVAMIDEIDRVPENVIKAAENIVCMGCDVYWPEEIDMANFILALAEAGRIDTK